MRTLTLHQEPALISLLEEGETVDNLASSPPQSLLIRWINHILIKSSSDLTFSNFNESENNLKCLQVLVNYLLPCTSPIDIDEVATKMRERALEVDASSFLCTITGEEIKNGTERVQQLIYSSLFRLNMGLSTVSKEVNVICFVIYVSFLQIHTDIC
jgi:hypothetical protein